MCGSRTGDTTQSTGGVNELLGNEWKQMTPPSTDVFVDDRDWLAGFCLFDFGSSSFITCLFSFCFGFSHNRVVNILYIYPLANPNYSFDVGVDRQIGR